MPAAEPGERAAASKRDPRESSEIGWDASGPAHDHDRDHHHDHESDLVSSAGTGNVIRRRLRIALALTAGYLVAEVVGGLLTGSLALLADAGHMLSDVASLALSLGALALTRRPASERRTYGFHRAEVIAASLNGLALVAAAVWISVEAMTRLAAPPPVWGGPMLAVALGGLAINLAVLRSLHGSHYHSLNLRGAWLHVVADTLGSVGAIVASALILFFDWRLADPVASVLISLLILGSALALLRDAAHVLMEGAPSRPASSEVLDAMTGIAGVASIHDLHIWTIGQGKKALTAHVVRDPAESSDAVLERVQHRLRKRFGLVHVTVQVESTPGCEHSCSFDRSG